jgi:hypothetical protein
MFFALLAADPIWRQYGAEVVVTAGIEGRHMDGSDHYRGEALDLRSRDLTDVPAAALALQSALGDDFVVLIETPATPGATGSHVHVSFRPRHSYAA